MVKTASLGRTATLTIAATSCLAPIGLATTLPANAETTDLLAGALTLSSYAPVRVPCPPNEQLIRPASGIAAAEASYIAARKPKADAALKQYLKHTEAGFRTDCDKYPTLGLTTSGGGLRSFLTGAGVHQAFDARDSTVSTKGLYQAFTYESALSGGAWLLSSIAGNNWPTVSSLKKKLWEQTLMDSLLDPDSLLASEAYAEIINDIDAKTLAGFTPTAVDVYGRLLSYEFLYGPDGGVRDQMSGLSLLSNFTGHNVPFPIVTALGVYTAATGSCYPVLNATQYEFTPYEFGSWDHGVHAFAKTKYLGSDLTNGKPTKAGQCVTNYDNQGYVMGTSSDELNVLCGDLRNFSGNSSLEGIINDIIKNATTDLDNESLALYPNPFKGYTSQSPLVAGSPQLTLSDGGEANQNDPIWPFLYRPSVQVLAVNDASADTTDNYPNGTEIRTTYERSLQVGLQGRMPFIPTVDVFVAEGLNKRPTFFGCHATDPSTLTILWLPNYNYTYDSGQSTFRIQYDVAATDAMIANGVATGSYNSSATFGTCLACGIMNREASAKPLPAACTSCLKEFCYN